MSKYDDTVRAAQAAVRVEQTATSALERAVAEQRQAFAREGGEVASALRAAHVTPEGVRGVGNADKGWLLTIDASLVEHTSWWLQSDGRWLCYSPVGGSRVDQLAYSTQHSYGYLFVRKPTDHVSPDGAVRADLPIPTNVPGLYVLGQRLVVPDPHHGQADCLSLQEALSASVDRFVRGRRSA